MKVILKFENKKESQEFSLDLHQNFICGRGPDTNTKLKDDRVSTTHCKFLLKKDRLEILDLDSKNGTYLNGIRIEQSEIFMGDEVKVGDTLITILEQKMDTESVETLTFPGPFKERLNYELKADFTGARIQSQLYNKEHPEEQSSSYQLRELNLRKKARSKIRLSKQEIKNRHRMLSVMALFVDFGCLLAIISIPIYLVNSVASSGTFLGYAVDETLIRNQQITIILFAEIVIVMAYVFMNSKLLKYSIGEKLLGIEDLHSKQ